MSSDYVIPNKILGYLKRAIPQLEYEFDLAGKFKASEFLNDLTYYVRVASNHDNWNGETYIHEVILFVGEKNRSIFDDGTISIVEKLLKKMLKKYSANISNEVISSVTVDFAEESDPEFLSSQPVIGTVSLKPENMGMWKENCLRVFISHRDYEWP